MVKRRGARGEGGSKGESRRDFQKHLVLFNKDLVVATEGTKSGVEGSLLQYSMTLTRKTERLQRLW